MGPTNDLQRPQFCWQADVEFGYDSRNAAQGGLAGGFKYIFSSKGDENGAGGEGAWLWANADGSLTAGCDYSGSVTTAAGKIPGSNTWVNVAVCFEDASDGGLSIVADSVGAGRQIWDGTLKIYVNNVEEASGAAQHVLNDGSSLPLLGQWRFDVGITPNLAFDNILIAGSVPTSTTSTTTTTTTTTTSTTTTTFAGPSYAILHQSAGDGEDDAPPGQLDRIPDLSGNGNQLWSQSTPGVLDSVLSHTEFNDGLTPPYTMTWNGGTPTMAPTNDLQRQEFCWRADVRFTPNGRGAGQGGIAGGFQYIFSSKGDEGGTTGEGVSMWANADGSLTALAQYNGSVTTAAGLVADNTWVNVAVCFEGAVDGGNTIASDSVGVGRRVWDGTLKIYVNNVEEASVAAQQVLNDGSSLPLLAQWRFDVGITPNLAFDNIEFSGNEVAPWPGTHFQFK